MESFLSVDFAFTNWIMFEKTLRRSCLVVCLWLSLTQMSGQTLVWTQEHYAVQTKNRGQHGLEPENLVWLEVVKH